MTTESGPLDLTALAELAGRTGYVPQRELRCHPDVSLRLKLTLPGPEPEFPFTGTIGALAGIPVTECPDFEPGTWELREDGEVTAGGRLDVPPWITAPATLDVTFDVTFPRVIDRYHPWFPVTAPVPIAMLGSVI